MDINLVNSATNPKAQTATLTFNFEDKISGISNPSITNDWINTSNQNVQVKLERVGNDEIVLYDSATNPDNETNGIVSVSYGSATGLNKTGSVKIVLDPTNDNKLGHLKLTIKVIDNVSNWTEKTYDLYVFCLTGEIGVVESLPTITFHPF